MTECYWCSAAGTPLPRYHPNGQVEHVSDLPMWLIWSNEHGMWWAPDERGYTAVIEAAGLYGGEDAERIVENASAGRQITVRRTGPLGEVLDVPPEVAVPCTWLATDVVAGLGRGAPVRNHLGRIVGWAKVTEGEHGALVATFSTTDWDPGVYTVDWGAVSERPIIETGSGPGG